METAKITTECPSGEGEEAGHLAQLAECLPTEYKSLGSTHSTAQARYDGAHL